jgi:hypothetical protein
MTTRLTTPRRRAITPRFGGTHLMHQTSQHGCVAIAEPES